MLRDFDKTVKLVDGAADIARVLGYEPEETVWDYSMFCPPESGLVLPDRTLGIAHEGITSLIRGGANGLTLKMCEAMLEYQRKYLGIGNVVEATDTIPETNIYTYPEHDLAENLLRKADRNPAIRDFFNNKVMVSIYPTVNYQTVARELGARTVIDEKQALAFNSKKRVFEDAKNFGYEVAPFSIACSREEIDEKFNELQHLVSTMGINAHDAKYWVKFDSMAGGTGVRTFRPKKEPLSTIDSWVDSIMQSCGLSDENFLPILMDLDIGHLPEVKRVLTNANVQGICGKDGAYFTGVTFQKTTKDGGYIGGTMPYTDEQHSFSETARSFAVPVFEAAWLQGYRGYAGVDVMVCEMEDGSHKGYVIEMNGRLNSSTSMLSMKHKMDDICGTDNTAADNFLGYFRSMDSYETFSRAFDDLLYKGEESGHTGIVPIIVKRDSEGKIYGLKTISVAPTRGQLNVLENRFNARVSSLQPL